MNKFLSTTFLSSFVALGLSSMPLASAQEASDPDTVETVNDQSEDVSRQDKIVITGSRIASEFTSSAPIQVITSERSTLEGLVDLADVLQGASVAGGSGQINNTFTGFVVDGGAGIDSIDLRGLGGQRTLVLLNGRRFPPAGVGGTVGPVDLNVIPSFNVDRIEILKDGASSVYGSDAVAGVINVITKGAYDGWKFEASANTISDAGGAEEFSVGAGYGKSFDRGDFNISLEYYRQEALRQGDRDNFKCPQDFYFNEDGTRADAIDTNTGEFKCFNSVEGYFQTFWSPTAPFGLAGGFYGSRVPDPAGTNSEGYPGYRFIPFQERSYNDPREEEVTIFSPRERLTLFGTGTYRPASFDTTELYGEFLWHNRKSNQDNYRQLFPWYHPDVSLNPYSADNPAFDYGVLFGLAPGSFAAPSNGFTARPLVLIPFNSEQDVSVVRLLGGARGDLNIHGLNDWSWDAYLSYSNSNGDYTRDVVPADRIDAGTGTIQNGITLNPEGVCGPSAPAGCVPLDLFNTNALFDGVFSDAEQAYYFLQETGSTEYSQIIGEISATGDLVEWPSGPVSAAFGVSFRKDEIDDVPGEFSLGSNAWGLLNAIETKGDDTVIEAFGELSVPIVRNEPLFEDLTLNLSGRLSGYNSVGNAATYKVGLNWQINPTFRLRATKGTSFRAPALYELFLGNQTSFLDQNSVDPCIGYGSTNEENNVDPAIAANCAADGLPLDWGGGGSSAEILTGGGLNLEPEESEATTVGFIFTPSFMDISFAVDYFEIEVENQISSSSLGVVTQCYLDPGFRDSSPFCGLFTRVLDPAAANFGTITNIDASYRNLPSAVTSGFDYTIAYSKEFDFGTLQVDGQATYTDDESFQEFPGSEVFEFSGTDGEPDWYGQIQARFQRGDWTTTWTTNYVDGTDNLGYRGEEGRVNPFYAPNASIITKVDQFITHNLSVRKEWDNLAIVAGVRNLTDEEPSLVSDSDAVGSVFRLGNYPLSSQYVDGYIGRSFFVTIARDF